MHVSLARTLNRDTTAGYRDLMSEVRMSFSGDPWGTVSGWLIGIATVVYVLTGEILPDFGPSPLLDLDDWRMRIIREDYESSIAYDGWEDGHLTIEDMRNVYAILSRYADWVELAGRRY